MDDSISRKAAIDALNDEFTIIGKTNAIVVQDYIRRINNRLHDLPSAQPDGIPIEWINKHLEWLDNCDNDFAQLAKVSIRSMVELWKKDRI